MVDKSIRIGIIAGEVSGDILGSELIKAIKLQMPNITFAGIGGPRMLAEGFESLVPMEKLSVMGLVEVLGRIRELVKIRRSIISHFLANPPDVFVGIDAPDFNLTVEKKLRQVGIPTVHYVSPTVWAWRQKRIKKIKKSVDHMLTLFPFEAEFYHQHDVHVTYVGHPLADRIPFTSDQQVARQQLQLPADKIVVALLPGSRHSEIERMGELFFQVVHWCVQKNPHLLFVVPSVNQSIQKKLIEIKHEVGNDLPVMIIADQSQVAMAAADAVLLTSGTASLEAMLHKRPMVVAYRAAPLSMAIAKRMVKIDHISLPNLLAKKSLVPEYIQQNATVEKLGTALLKQLEPGQTNDVIYQFEHLHRQLQCNAAEKAAAAVISMIKEK